MSESKSNAARHGLKVGDMVGILGADNLGRIGRVWYIGKSICAGECMVFVNGKASWFDIDLLCKISRRGLVRRKQPRRKTANAKHEANGGTSGAIRLDFFAPPTGEHEPTVGAGAGSEPQPEAPKAEPKFKPGDRVICEGISGGVSGKVMYVGWEGDKLFVLSDDENSYSWLPASFYRHAPAEPSPATESAPEPEKPQFKPFDRVLVRDREDGTWYPALYAFCDGSMDYPHLEVGGLSWRYCIPYEGNEALAGTTNDPEKG